MAADGDICPETLAYVAEVLDYVISQDEPIDSTKRKPIFDFNVNENERSAIPGEVMREKL
jgi:hypothetical protein